MVFIDLQKAYDKVPRNVMWQALEKKKVPTKYVNLIKNMYDNVVTSVRACDGETDNFPIKIGLHQGSALRPFIFALVMDEITKDIQGDIPWCMFFADDVILIDESKIVLIANQSYGGRLWNRNGLDLVGLKLSI